MSFQFGRCDKEFKDNLESGKWFNFQGAEFLIAHLGNTKMVALQQESKESEDGNSVDVIADRLANGVVLDYKIPEDDTPYDATVVAQEIKDNPEFLAFVMGKCNDFEVFKRERKEAKLTKVKKP